MGRNIDGLATLLRRYRAHPSTKRVVVLGSSGGGYAALLFGQLLQEDEVHAFSPRTFVGPIARIAARDVPPTVGLRGMWRMLLRGQRRYFDLRRVLLKTPAARGEFHIYYSTQYPKDHLHALRMSGIHGFNLHAYEHDGHHLIKSLRQSGELREILARALYGG